MTATPDTDKIAREMRDATRIIEFDTETQRRYGGPLFMGSIKCDPREVRALLDARAALKALLEKTSGALTDNACDCVGSCASAGVPMKMCAHFRAARALAEIEAAVKGKPDDET